MEQFYDSFNEVYFLFIALIALIIAQNIVNLAKEPNCPRKIDICAENNDNDTFNNNSNYSTILIHLEPCYDAGF